MVMNYEYYYNITPEHGKVRNNLIYTSLISQDKKTFVQWYHNDTEYHKGKNQIVDPELMEEKWDREVKFLPYMAALYPYKVPRILDIDYTNKKIFLEIDGVDLWQRSLDNNCSFENIVPDWKEQMLDIVRAHKEIGLYKYSMHPSSYFIVEGKLVTINYFFVYFKNEGPKILKDHQSHISLDRQAQMKTIVESQGIKWDQPEPLDVLQRLCFDSFRTNFSDDFIDKAKEIYHD
jgi:hypothetical protein